MKKDKKDMPITSYKEFKLDKKTADKVQQECFPESFLKEFSTSSGEAQEIGANGDEQPLALAALAARAGRGATVNEWLTERCQVLESTVKSLQSEIRMLKSSERKTKRQLRVDYDWDGENANLSDKVSYWVKTYLFPRYKFLKDGWMAYDKEHDSLSSFVQRKMNMEDEDDFKGLWERVISPTIQMKYVTVRCNLK